MKIMAAILHRITRRKAVEPDAFELRLITMGSENTKAPVNQIALPNLFCRRAGGVRRAA